MSRPSMTIFGAIDVPSDYEIVRMILLHEGIDGE
jgi:hypothetical protein